MGRGSRHSNAARANLRVLPGGRTGDRPTAGLSPLDRQVERLWLAERDELTAAAGALARASDLDPAELGALQGRLNFLSEQIGLPPCWQLIAQRHPSGRECVHAAYAVTATAHPSADPGLQMTHFCVLEGHFDGGTIDRLSEPRYLARKLCELPAWITEHFGLSTTQALTQ